MKNIFKKVSVLGLGLVALSQVGCNDFEEINRNPTAADETSILPYYLLTNSIYGPQMDPHIAERVFILYWDRVARFETAGGLSLLSGSNDWSTDYFNAGYLSGWTNLAHQAVKVAEQRIESGIYSDGTNNIMQMARVWRAYLYAEMADNFGPAPLEGYNGENVEYNSVQEVYEFILSELADAASKLDVSAEMSTEEMEGDLIFAGDISKWIKYANSMRLRYAMRLKGVNPSYAQAQFEAAAGSLSSLLTDVADVAAVQEEGGWCSTTGVMSRTWNTQSMSFTMANLTMGIGGVSLTDISAISGTAAYGLTAEQIAQYSKDPSTYLGVRMPDMLSTKTNINNAGYLMDYMPSKVDPRALVNYSIPGHNDGVVGSFNSGGTVTNLRLSTATEPDTLKMRVQYSWVGLRFGEGGDKSALFTDFTGSSANYPIKSAKLRDNTNKRIFFGPWETYFLLAEAAHYGWSTPMGGQSAYEAGIQSSFDYQGVGALASAYMASDSYNMVGTSASYTHTTEIASRAMEYVELPSNMVADGEKAYKISETPAMTSVEYKFPTGIYTTNNDVLTKIITQKYIAQVPWLPNEAWSDYRRLGLPFMENPLLEKAISTMPNYTDYTKASMANVGQRLVYPMSLQTANASGYASAVTALGGTDAYTTPLWWSKAATDK